MLSVMQEAASFIMKGSMKISPPKTGGGGTKGNPRGNLSNIIEFLPDATVVIDKDKKVIAWNRAIEAMTGIKEGRYARQG